jgi:tetratricopeptide (TPR) repeat protein
MFLWYQISCVEDLRAGGWEGRAKMGEVMSSNRRVNWVWLAVGIMSAGLLVPAVSSGQAGAPPSNLSPPGDNSLTRTDDTRTSERLEETYMSQTLGDPKEEAAYQAFRKADEPAKKIKLGNAFLAKYPGDRYSQAVYEELTQSYYDRNDLADFYSYSAKGLALFPDDVHLLALSGWVIPRAFTPNDPDGDKKLDKAESQEKHALDVLGKMAKPPVFTDQQFAEFKTGEAAEAHSGLGLVYFRREKYDESAKELQTAVAGEAKPDQTDLFVLGADYENLSRFREAADAFNRCAQIAGSMQDRCKQLASAALQQASGAK